LLRRPIRIHREGKEVTILLDIDEILQAGDRVQLAKAAQCFVWAWTVLCSVGAGMTTLFHPY